jgi:TolA-binding protein
MSCPDNLLIGHRRGALSDQEQARLDGHLGGCPTCRLALQLGFDFDRVLDTVPGDDLIAARFARNLGPKLELQRARPRTQREERRYVLVAAAAIAVIGSAGLAAAKLGAWPFALPAAEPATGHARAHALSVLRKPPVVLAPGPAAAGSTAEPVHPTPEHDEALPERAPPATELFARANAHRREGEPLRARSLYHQLQQLYPRSAEVEVSFVSLGRLELELGEPRDALEQFDRYLTKSPRGALAEEALFGKASALERLGRGAAERAVWQTLLADHPSSVYADRARHRLERIP